MRMIKYFLVEAFRLYHASRVHTVLLARAEHWGSLEDPAADAMLYTEFLLRHMKLVKDPNNEY